MGEIISFPDENERLQKLADKQLAKGDFLAAKKSFKKLYEKSPNERYARKLIQILVRLGDYTSARSFFEEHGLLTEEQDFSDYLHVLMLDNQFLTCHKWLQKRPNIELLEELDQLEQAHDLISSVLMERQEQLASYDQRALPLSPEEWQNFTQSISLAEFLQLVQTYLPQADNPFLPPRLVEELVACGAKGEISLGEKKLALESLTLPEQAPVFVQIMHEIEAECQDQPQLLELILADLNATFALMYPLLPALSEADSWVQSYLLEYQLMFGNEKVAVELNKYAQIQKKKTEIRLIYQKINHLN